MQAVLEGEVREVLNALGGDVKLVYVIVNKRADAKF